MKKQSALIPEGRVELTQFRVEIRAGLVQLEEREIHVTVTLNSAQKQILKIQEEVLARFQEVLVRSHCLYLNDIIFEVV